jgi:hypothetical protein
MQPYSPQEMLQIFIKKSLDGGWIIDKGAITDEFIKEHSAHFKHHGGDMELLFVKCKIAHSKNLLAGKSKIKRCISEADIKDGIQLFIKNSNTLDENSFIKNMYI